MTKYRWKIVQVATNLIGIKDTVLGITYFDLQELVEILNAYEDEQNKSNETINIQ